MQTEARVAPQPYFDGSIVPLRAGRTGEVNTADAHGKYFEAASRGNVWTASNTASQALSLLSGTATGLILRNPVSSGKNYIVMDICAQASAVIAAVGTWVVQAWLNPIQAVPTGLTSVAVRNVLLGGPQVATAAAYSGATFVDTPVVVRVLNGWHWVTAGTDTEHIGIKDDVSGALVVTPGVSISVAGLVAASSAIVSMTWEEVPV